MMNNIRTTAAIAAISLCMTLSAIPVYAHGIDGEETKPTAETVLPTEPDARPFTPEGEGTVIDNATDGDGKEFYTIQTPDENVFYLVIDRQRTGENVYFLNAVTEDDLMSLAKTDKKPEAVNPKPVPETKPEPKPESQTGPKPETKPETKPKQSGMGTILIVLAVAAIGGGTGWYIKVYRPKHGIPELDEDESEYEGEAAELDDEDITPWDEGEPEPEDETEDLE